MKGINLFVAKDRPQKGQIMFEIVAMGEALIDFTPAGKSQDGRNLYEQNAGGSVANLAAAAAKLGADTAFIGKVGADTQGEHVIREMKSCGVDVSGVVYDPDVYTTLVFVTLDEKGERDFSFVRKPGADTCMERSEVSDRLLTGAKILHFGALALNSNPTRDTTYAVIDQIHAQGGLVAFDANYRYFLWPSVSAYKARALLAISKADILKISEEEAFLLCGSEDVEANSLTLMKQGPSIVCLTMGEGGCYIRTHEGSFHISAYPVEKVVDTTGAGDCFFGAFLSQLVKAPQPLHTSLVVLKDMARFANAAAALCVGKRGGIPSIPTKAQVAALVMQLPLHDN